MLSMKGEIIMESVKLVKPSIEQRKFDEFMRKFKDDGNGKVTCVQEFKD